jgi:hypothetical protein
MRFHEFADPKPYTLSAADATDLLKQLLRIWPDRSVNNLPPLVLIKQPPARPR